MQGAARPRREEQGGRERLDDHRGRHRAGVPLRRAARAVGSTLSLSDNDYLLPADATQHPWMPLFTWKPVDGARGYFVVVARDEEFTKIVDLAFTNVPVYAPRRNAVPWTYPDETTSYWWAVVPTALANGDIAPTPADGQRAAALHEAVDAAGADLARRR